MTNYKPGTYFKYKKRNNKIVKILGTFSTSGDLRKTYYKVSYLNDEKEYFIVSHSSAVNNFIPLHLQVVE
jgi:hypothetical protein